MEHRDHRKKHNPHMLDAHIGLERESLRVDADGRLARTVHPFPGDPQIDRDFSENQTEFITGIYETPGAVYDALFELHRRAARGLAELPTGQEYLWPFSNPPVIGREEENSPAQYYGDAAWKTEYRNHLRERYGTRLMLYSGVHFNFSFSDAFFEQMYRDFCGNCSAEDVRRFCRACGKAGQADLTAFRDACYLNMSAWGTRYAWLVVYLFAASSVLDPSFFDDPETAAADERHLRYSSPRSSEIGYWNTFDPVLDYSDLKRYVDSIVRYVEDGSLMIPAELYYPVRVKPAGLYRMEALREEGISHIEFRTVDVNPYSPVGIFREDIQFLHLLMVYLMYREEKPFTPEEQLDALHDLKKAALYDDSTVLSNGISVRENARLVLADIEGFFRKGVFTSVERRYIREALTYQKRKLAPGCRYAEIVRREFGENYQEKGLELAKKHAETLR